MTAGSGKNTTQRNWRLWKTSWKKSDSVQYLFSMSSGMTETEFLKQWNGAKCWTVGLVRRKPIPLLVGLMLESSPACVAIQLLWGMDLTFKERVTTLSGSEYHGIWRNTIRLLLEFTVRGRKIRLYSYTTW